MKKILCFLTALIFTLFAFSVPKYNNKLNTSFAYNNTYNFEATINNDSNSMGNYSISDVYTFTSYGQPVFKITINNNTASHRTIINMSTNSSSSESWLNYQNIHFNNPDISFCLIAQSGSVYAFRNGTDLQIMVSANGVVDLYFSNLYFSGVSNKLPVFIGSRSGYIPNTQIEDSSNLVDMSSDTNSILDSFSLYSFIPTSTGSSLALQSIAEVSFDSYTSISNINSIDSTRNTLYANNGGTVTTNAYYDSIYLNQIFNYASNPDNLSNHGFNLLIYTNRFDVQVYRPVLRVNNTLVLYNFDYPNLVSDINKITYSLSRDNDLYVIDYTGSIPNYYFSFFFNEDIQNTLFDEYIDVSFYFSSNLHTSTLQTVTLIDGSFTSAYCLNAGFDFNFTYYTQPLVSTNGVYNYTFSKPSYVDMPFSLAPFYIPILEMIENALIFLLFYCPIVSDILSMLHFDEFMGAFLQVFNYYASGVLGTFLTALFTFIIFYFLLKFIMPSVSSGISSSLIKIDEKRKNKLEENKEENKKEKKNKDD